MNLHSSVGKIVFDFSTASHAAGWQIVNDAVMGGVSDGEFRLAKGVAIFSGNISLENNGGFASVRSLPSQ
jgi:monofunctional biosynthetic peptidoglycan transglycosylase